MAVPVETPVFHDPGFGSHRFINMYPVALTGYVVRNTPATAATELRLDGSGVGPVVDLRLTGERPINGGDNRDFSRPVSYIPPSLAPGGRYYGGEVIAAIYADGTTFGDSLVVKAMMDHRRQLFDSLSGFASALCQVSTSASSDAEVLGAIDKQHAAQDSRTPDGAQMQKLAYDDTWKPYRGANRNLPPTKKIAIVVAGLNKVRFRLAADPVKDASGQLVIPPSPDVVCAAP